MGARRIAGITVEIGGDTTKLTTALTDVDKALSTTQSSLRDVNKLLKLDPGNTELLAQKHRLLGEAVSETKEKLATLKTAAEQANQALANGESTQSQYDALQREIIETEQKLKDLERQAENSSVALQKIGQVCELLGQQPDSLFCVYLFRDVLSRQKTDYPLFCIHDAACTKSVHTGVFGSG